MSMTDQMDAIRGAVERTDDRLEFLSRVPQADTAAAQRAVDGLRLEILSEFHTAVLVAIGGRRTTPESAA